MSEVRLNIVDAGSPICGIVPGSEADVAVPALSTELDQRGFDEQRAQRGQQSLDG